MVEEKYEISEAFQVEKNEKNKNENDFLNYLDNVFKCVGYEENHQSRYEGSPQSTTITSNEVWSILETKYSKEGSNILHLEEASVQEAKHKTVFEIKGDSKENGESHYAQPYVENDTSVTPTTYIVDDIELVNPTIEFFDDSERKIATTIERVNPTRKIVDEKCEVNDLS